MRAPLLGHGWSKIAVALSLPLDRLTHHRDSLETGSRAGALKTAPDPPLRTPRIGPGDPRSASQRASLRSLVKARRVARVPSMDPRDDCSSTAGTGAYSTLIPDPASGAD
jgi:hypothetical protein